MFIIAVIKISIHALLAESDRLRRKELQRNHISIHALLAESDVKIGVRRLMNRLFLSTLSLRRATQQKSGDGKTNVNFYPRSPCGERQGTQLTVADVYKISIHALLAESDATEAATTANEALFLSTLSLRRATKHFAGAKLHDPDFYPRSPCGERPHSAGPWQAGRMDFYPRSPCGERP